MGKTPVTTITDQDLGIRKALSRVFPYTHHRLCKQHKLDKVPDKLALWAYNQEFMIPFKINIWTAVCPEKFEAIWTALLEKYDLNND